MRSRCALFGLLLVATLLAGCGSGANSASKAPASSASSANKPPTPAEIAAYQGTDRDSYIGFAYNTSSRPESSVPKTYKDLLNPALKGKMSISAFSGTGWLGNAPHPHAALLFADFVLGADGQKILESGRRWCP